jgi:hypothetical protein
MKSFSQFQEDLASRRAQAAQNSGNAREKFKQIQQRHQENKQKDADEKALINKVVDQLS